MNTICYAVVFIDKNTFRMKSIGLYSEGPMTLTYDHGHDSAAELFRLERSSGFQDARDDAVQMLAMRFRWADDFLDPDLIDDVKDARRDYNEKIARTGSLTGEEE